MGGSGKEKDSILQAVQPGVHLVQPTLLELILVLLIVCCLLCCAYPVLDSQGMSKVLNLSGVSKW